jgi:membrane-associated protease RseP (regulator of RpoE activity)
MNLKNTLYFMVSLLLTCGIVLAQEAAPPAPDAPPMPAVPGEAPGSFSFFIGGGSFLGVYAEDINKENMGRYGLREARGVAIKQIVKDSPAEKAGLKKDDVILRFEGDSVTSVRKLNRLVSEVAPDQTVRLVISRGGAEQEVSVTIGKRNNATNAFHRLEGLEGLQDLEGLEDLKELHKAMPPGEHGPQIWKWEGQPGGDMIWAFGNHRRIGVSTMELSKQLADYFGIGDGKGVLVTSVVEDSPAAKAGIKAGDVITAVDGEKIDGSGDLARGINKKKEGDVTLTVIRDKNQRTITVTPKEVKPPQTIGAPRVGRTIVIPRVELGSTPEVNVVIPRMDLPTTPEVNIQLPRRIRMPRVRVIRTGIQGPI